MTSYFADLYAAAERLDDAPTEILNGGAVQALSVLAASASDAQTIASARGIEQGTVDQLWEQATVRLRTLPSSTDLFPAAAEAATLLYAAAWVLDPSGSATTEGLRDLL